MFAAGACANRLVVASGLTSLTGTLFGDLIIGSDRADRISAGAGDDCLEGRAGKDVLRGGPGADRSGVAETVNCGSGNDRATVDKGDRVIGCERVTRRKGTNGDTTE